jgi:DnaJ like chaperone protein
MMRLLLLLFLLGYLASPYDLFPDFFLGPGWIDDLILVGLYCWYFFVYRRKRSGYKDNHQGTHGTRAGKGQDRFREARDSEQGFRKNGSLKDAYSVLGVSRNASPETIRTAYRRLAGQYHPDKVVHLGEEFRELADRRFKEIQAAYDELKSQSR